MLCHQLSNCHTGRETSHSARVSEDDKFSDTFVHFVFLGEELISKDLPYILIIPYLTLSYINSRLFRTLSYVSCCQQSTAPDPGSSQPDVHHDGTCQAN